jgi:hypothetical protein
MQYLKPTEQGSKGLEALLCAVRNRGGCTGLLYSPVGQGFWWPKTSGQYPLPLHRSCCTHSEAPHVTQIPRAVLPLANTQARACNSSLPTRPQGLPNVRRHSNDRVKPRKELALLPAPDAQRGASEGTHITPAREHADSDGV